MFFVSHGHLRCLTHVYLLSRVSWKDCWFAALLDLQLCVLKIFKSCRKADKTSAVTTQVSFTSIHNCSHFATCSSCNVDYNFFNYLKVSYIYHNNLSLNSSIICLLRTFSYITTATLSCLWNSNSIIFLQSPNSALLKMSLMANFLPKF